MAKKKFSLNTQPHEAEIGDVTLQFQPEVMGDEFLDTYSRLQETMQRLNVDLTDMASVDLSQVRETTQALRVFLARLMLPESAAQFVSWDVLSAAGKVLSSHRTPEEAQEAADGKAKSTVVDNGLRLPDRVLVELLEWVVELYGGGQRPPTSSNASAPASSSPGTPGRAASRSRGSMSTRGR
ncbi:hypothetical protein ACFWAP_08925 [Streptomyces goshikiensis]|uniref:hypothetical protein n=1 Tax=Streptomyces goshikiensis TaxID=1942 RepID=UPI003666EAA1